MRGKCLLQAGLAVAALAGGMLLASTSFVSASSVASTVGREQKQLEQQLANWAALLGQFGTDVVDSATLTSAHALVLDARSTGTDARLDTLVAEVPTDTTQAQLNAAKTATLELDLEFAVLTPQVNETIDADSITSQVRTFISEEQPLDSMVNAIAGQPGYDNAHAHFVSLVRAVSLAQHDVGGVATLVLAQKTVDFPGDTDIFVHSNQKLSSASVALAQANYDENVVGLSAGGYAGS